MPSLPKSKMTFVDLFSGAGGLTLGFELEGFDNIFSVDNEKQFCETYKLNFPKHFLIEKDIKNVSSEDIIRTLKGRKVTVVVGGPPCQGFSIAGHIGRKFIDDPRNNLFKEFIRIVEVIKPSYFVMENVARLYTHNQGKTKKEIIHRFESLGYKVTCTLVNAADFGVPQMRRRILFIGSRTDTPLALSEKGAITHNTVRAAIGDLPPLASGEVSTIPNHEAMRHSEQMLKKMHYVREGGTRIQIPSTLRPVSGDVRKYIRYNGNEPAVCVTGDMRKIFHYSQNRALTVRELARLQSFPDSFVFKGSRISQQQQVGNAVPPLLARAIARSIKKHTTHELA